jgi:hypothetical protein
VRSRYSSAVWKILNFCVGLPCGLEKLMKVGEFVAEKRTTCKACDKPAGQACGRCEGVKYCSKVILHLVLLFNTCRSVR